MSKFFLSVLAATLALSLVAPDLRAQENAASSQKTAVFAGGCFWCMQKPFDQTPGVVKTVVGYCGGGEANPTYEQVSAKKTGHRESIQVTYDPSKVSYDQLLDVFWHQIDPTQGDGQFADRGQPYKAAIFYANEEEKKLAEASKAKLGESGKFNKPLVTDLLPAAPFYAAEDYHQKYYQKNAADYQAYYVGSGRAGFLEKTWGKAAKP
jgi:methionine-S-sulfoxide reductase